MRAYHAAFDGSLLPERRKPSKRQKANAGTLKWLCEAYFSSAEFKQLDPRTKRVRRNLLDALCRDYGPKPAKLNKSVSPKK